MLVSHDLGVVARIADRVAVMYAGKIVEIGTAEEIFYDPRHPYTWGLLGALPSQAVENGELRGIPGMPPTLLDPPPGDAFAERNQYAMKIDYERMPPMFPVSETHSAATWLLDESGARGHASRHHQTPRYGPLKNPALLSVRNYKQHFPINKSLTVHAVNGISFDLRRGNLRAGRESGCGKSTVARAIMGIYTPTEGEIYFKDFLISEKRSYREHKKDIQRNMQVIFQDSAAALNPRMKVADIIAEALGYQSCLSR